MTQITSPHDSTVSGCVSGMRYFAFFLDLLPISRDGLKLLKDLGFQFRNMAYFCQSGFCLNRFALENTVIETLFQYHFCSTTAMQRR
ncbi:MAG: hypothetical protein ACKVU2_10140, partial [Saprospiraceae bacterium]